MSTKIPKVMHFYWGGGKLSYLQYLTIVSFNRFNPDWEIIIFEPTETCSKITWETDEQKIKHGGVDYYDELKKLSFVKIKRINFYEIGFREDVPEVFKSDYLRWYLLSSVGGGWSDIDILYTAPISNINISDEDTVICLYNNIHIIGFYLSKPKNEFFKNILENCDKYFDETKYQCIGSSMLNDIYPNMETIEKSHENLKIKNLAIHTVYPFYHDEVNMIFNEKRLDKVRKDTIGVHWYNGTRVSKFFNFNFSPNFTNTNTITELLLKQN
jgi:hypothetical protein